MSKEKEVKRLIELMEENNIPLEYLDHNAINGVKVGIYNPTAISIELNQAFGYTTNVISGKKVNYALCILNMQEAPRINNKIHYELKEKGKDYATYEFTVIKEGESIVNVKSTIKWTRDIIPVLLEYFSSENVGEYALMPA